MTSVHRVTWWYMVVLTQSHLTIHIVGLKENIDPRHTSDPVTHIARHKIPIVKCEVKFVPVQIPLPESALSTVKLIFND